MNRSYALKLHRDSHPLRDAMAGWLENMATGAHRAFSSGEQLLELLEGDLAAAARRRLASAQCLLRTMTQAIL